MRELFRNISLREANAEDINYVLRRLEENHAREVYLLRFDKSPDSLIAEFLAMRSVELELKAVFFHERAQPVALLGLWLNTPGTALVGMLATPDLPQVIKDLTRYIREEFMARWRQSGTLQRVEVRALADWTQCCRWISQTLSPDEAYLCRGVGKDGSDYMQFAWIEKG